MELNCRVMVVTRRDVVFWNTKCFNFL